MFWRLAIFAALVAALPALLLAVRGWAAVRRRRVVSSVRDPGLTQGTRTLLYFTGEYCTTCRYRQKPAIESLRADMNGTLRVVEVDAAAEPALVKRFNVLSLPTTVVLAPDGRVGAVNYGFAPGDQLRAQLAGLG